MGEAWPSVEERRKGECWPGVKEQRLQSGWSKEEKGKMGEKGVGQGFLAVGEDGQMRQQRGLQSSMTRDDDGDARDATRDGENRGRSVNTAGEGTVD